MGLGFVKMLTKLLALDLYYRNLPNCSWISHGFLMDFSWISHGFLMDFSWISNRVFYTQRRDGWRHGCKKGLSPIPLILEWLLSLF